MPFNEQIYFSSRLELVSAILQLWKDEMRKGLSMVQEVLQFVYILNNETVLLHVRPTIK